MSDLKQFEKNLHHSSKLVGRGTATVMGNTVDAIWVRNLYNQVIVWGMFSTERGKFKGKLANNVNTEGTVTRMTVLLEYDPPRNATEHQLQRQWFKNQYDMPKITRDTRYDHFPI